MEQVMVVKTKLLRLPQVSYIHSPNDLGNLLTICSANHQFVDRVKAEVDSSYKQLIPYVTILCGDNYLCLERTSAQSEARLHGKLSLGVGGHVNPVDNIGNFNQIITQAMHRELKEELWIETLSSPSLCGLINDDSNPVGAVHLGVHYILKTSNRPRVRETNKMTAFWYNLNQLEVLRKRFETWSQILLPALFKAGSL